MKLLLDESKFHGHMANPTAAQMKPPLRILMKRGRRAMMSDPAETELAAIFVPSWARAKPRAMKNTPARVPESGFASRKFDRRSSGFQMGSPYITVEDEDTMIPMNDVIANPQGMVIN